jgi:hypothetical protein
MRSTPSFSSSNPQAARKSGVSSEPASARSARRRERCVVFTVGHSTRTQDDFIALLKAHGVKQLVDVRTIPRSRHNPQFNSDSIASALHSAGIAYLHLKALGGLRHPRPDSLNTAWRNAGFRGFADYMQSADFAEGLRKLMEIAQTTQTAIMCAEAVPWRCHRSLIADALLVHGCGVEEIESLKRTRPHALTPWACVQGKQITYPAAELAAQEKPKKEKRLRAKEPTKILAHRTAAK